MTEQFLNWAAPKTDHLPDKDAALPLTTAEFWLRAFVKEVERRATIERAGMTVRPDKAFYFALQKVVKDFGLNGDV